MLQLYLNIRFTKVLNLSIKSEQKKYKLRSSLAKLVVPDFSFKYFRRIACRTP